MTNIAITGHRPDAFLVSHYSVEEVQRITNDTSIIFKREHGDNLTFLLGGALGTDIWMGQACLENNIKYHLFYHSSLIFLLVIGMMIKKKCCQNK